MLGVSVVVNHDRSRLPVHPQMPILPSLNVIEQEVQQRGALFLLHPNYSLGVQSVDIQRELFRDRMCSHNGVDCLDWLSDVAVTMIMYGRLRETGVNGFQAVQQCAIGV